MRAKLYFHNKNIYADGAITELKVWRVPKTWGTPEGYKYSMVYISREGKRILGYDNAERQGHHCHKGNRIKPIHFKSIENLVGVFYKEVRKTRRGKP